MVPKSGSTQPNPKQTPSQSSKPTRTPKVLSMAARRRIGEMLVDAGLIDN